MTTACHVSPRLFILSPSLDSLHFSVALFAAATCVCLYLCTCAYLCLFPPVLASRSMFFSFGEPVCVDAPPRRAV